MYLRIVEAADLLALSVSQLRKIQEHGGSVLSQHLKCSPGELKPKDRSAVRVPISNVAKYIATHTRDDAWSTLSDPGSPEELEEIERKIWAWASWYRGEKQRK